MASIHSLPPERRFQLLVEAVVDYAIFLLDPTGIVSSWNTGAQRIKGYSADEIIGKHFSIFYSPEDRAAGIPENSMRTALEKGRCEAEGWRYRKDGTKFWASVILDPVRSETGELLGFAKVTRDITERREAEQQLLAAREQLFQSQKMDAIGQLTGGIAHDFNNLLTIVLSGSQMIERLANGNEQLLRVVGHIRHAVERGDRLTRQLLTYSRRQALKPVMLDLATALTTFCEGILRTLRGDVEISLDVAQDLWPVEADPNELDLALINIAINARDAMPHGGELRVSARNDPMFHQGQSKARFVAISLTDTGMGMSPETLAKATEPFFTTKPPGMGTGLGLSQAYGFAKQSGGNLEIESTLGKGTTIIIHLPAAHISVSNRKATKKGKGLTVLVVEDEPMLAEMAQSMLSQAGYEVQVAENAGKGLEILRTTEVDAVFTDIVIPGGMNGLELARQIRRERPEIPILLTTGYYSAQKEAQAEHKVLRKPYDESTLLTAIQEVIASGAEGIS